MIFVFRGAVATGAPIVFSGFDGMGVLLAFIAFVLAAAAHGMAFGLWLLAALMIHEAGHVLAYRMLGHAPTRFRLAPLLSDLPISDRPLRTEAEAFFVALMGPGLSLAPMALSIALAAFLSDRAPQLAVQLQVFGVTIGALNFVNLLPFHPLDGGRCIRLAVSSFWPALAPAMAAFMIAMFFTAGLRTHSLTLFVLAAFGVQSFLHKAKSGLVPMGPSAALTALGAYAFTLAAHLIAGWMLLTMYF